MPSAPSHTVMPDAVLFDLDGTLIDSEPAWIAAEARLAAEFGVAWTPADQAAMIGVDLWEGARRFIAKGVPMDADAIVERLTGEVISEIATALPLRPGALDMLRSLREAEVPVALVTMSTRSIVDLVETAFARELGATPFAVTVAGDEVERGKPDPEPYLRAMRALGVGPARAIAVEDSLPGTASALASGAVTVGVPNEVSLDGVDGLVLWPSLAGRTAGDMAALLRKEDRA